MAKWLRRSFADGWRPSARRGRCSWSSRICTGETCPAWRTWAKRSARCPGGRSWCWRSPVPRSTTPSRACGRGRPCPELALGGLTLRAAERLVRAALGDGVTPEIVSRIVDRCRRQRVLPGGADPESRRGRRSDGLPETVLASVQSRLERLEPEARRLVRAASVFGEVFWQARSRRCSADRWAPTTSTSGSRRWSKREVFATRAREPLPGRARVRVPARPAPRGGLRDAHRVRPEDRAPARGRVAAGRRRETR